MHMQTMVRCFDGCPCNMMNSQDVSFVGKGKDHDGDDGRDDGKTWWRTQRVGAVRDGDGAASRDTMGERGGSDGFDLSVISHTMWLIIC